MFWKQSTVQESEITLQLPTEAASLVVVIWECTRMALGCAWSITMLILSNSYFKDSILSALRTC